MDSTNLKTLVDYAAAWNAHDIDRIMAMMTDDCVFLAGGGQEAGGERSVGAPAVRSRFVEVWTHFPDARWSAPTHVACGDRGFSTWLFLGTGPDGRRVEVNGCDLFSFRDGLIAVKDTYLKARD
jgi:ketosteroid isomerase-like protein